MKDRLIILTGCIGILGALLMFTGDMLLFYTDEQVPDLFEGIKQAIGNISKERLTWGGYVAPLAGLMIFGGFYQIYLAGKEFYPKLMFLVFVLFCCGFMYGSAAHTQYVLWGFALQDNLSLSKQIEENILNFGIVSGVSMTIANLIWIILVLMKKTLYPRWFILVSPIVLIVVGNLWHYLPQPYLMIVAGGWNNLLVGIFFSSSTIYLYKKR